MAEPDGCVGGAAVRARAPCSERPLEAPGEALPLLRRQLLVVAAVCKDRAMSRRARRSNLTLSACALSRTFNLHSISKWDRHVYSIQQMPSAFILQQSLTVTGPVRQLTIQHRTWSRRTLAMTGIQPTSRQMNVHCHDMYSVSHMSSGGVPRSAPARKAACVRCRAATSSGQATAGACSSALASASAAAGHSVESLQG